MAQFNKPTILTIVPDYDVIHQSHFEEGRQITSQVIENAVVNTPEGSEYNIITESFFRLLSNEDYFIDNLPRVEIINLTSGRDDNRIPFEYEEGGRSTLEFIFAHLHVLTNLKFVFISSFISKEFVEELTHIGIKAVISHNFPLDTELTHAFTNDFYEALFKEKKKLKDAFRIALNKYNTKVDEHLQDTWSLHAILEENLEWGITPLAITGKQTPTQKVSRENISDKILQLENALEKSDDEFIELTKLKDEWQKVLNDRKATTASSDTGFLKQKITTLEEELMHLKLNMFIDYKIQDTNTRKLVRRKKTLRQLRNLHQYHAIIIGINNYTHITKLKQAKKDAEAFKNLLEKDYHFEKVHYLPDATREEISDTFDELADVFRKNKNDSLLIFFAGHGEWDKDIDEGFWLPKDAEVDKRKNWLSNDAILRFVKRCNNCRHVLIISDACYSGAIFSFRDTKQAKEKHNPIVLRYEARSRQAITSAHQKPVPDKSAFFKELTSFLSKNTKEAISAQEVFASIQDQVSKNSPIKQLPQMGKVYDKTDEGGDFIFFKKNAKIPKK